MCEYVCAREKKRERKWGEGGSGLRQGEKEKANVNEKDRARKARQGWGCGKSFLLR